MARLKNVSTVMVTVGPNSTSNSEPWLQAGKQVALLPNQEFVIFNEDLEKSKGFAFYSLTVLSEYLTGQKSPLLRPSPTRL